MKIDNSKIVPILLPVYTRARQCYRVSRELIDDPTPEYNRDLIEQFTQSFCGKVDDLAAGRTVWIASDERDMKDLARLWMEAARRNGADRLIAKAEALNVAVDAALVGFKLQQRGEG